MKSIFPTLVAIALSLATLSVHENDRKYHCGASVYANFSTITGSDAKDLKTKMGIQVGVLYKPFLSEKISI